MPELPPVDRVLAATACSTMGAFRCPVEHPLFRDSGPISQCIVVFPRTSVRIKHEGFAPFLADPTVVTVYNRAQRYERFPVSPTGDHCDWFGVSDDVARDIVRAFDPAAAESERPFQMQWARSSSSLYVRQRALQRRAARGELTALELDEVVTTIVAEALRDAYRHRALALTNGTRATARRRELVDAARSELQRTVRHNVSVHDIADAIGTTPFHLCRVFRADTGVTMHRYRDALRMRLVLEALESRPLGQTISALALDVGYCSHAHLVRATRLHFGMTPTALAVYLG